MIDAYTFYKCRSLEEIILQEGIENIYEYAFWYCSSLRIFRFFRVLNFVSSRAFFCCDKLKKVDLNGKLYYVRGVKDDDDIPLTVWEIANSLRPIDPVPYDSQPFPAGYPYMDEFEYLNSGGED